MASILPVLLLGLFLQCTPSYAQQPCKLENPMDGGDFNITVSPHYYKPNTHYNVTISGMGDNVTVALAAYQNETLIGSWKNENTTDCAGIKREGNLPITEQWTSPSDSFSYVKFRAHVMMGNKTYYQKKTIEEAPDDMNNSTSMTTHGMTPMKSTTTAPKTTHDYNMTSPMTNMTSTTAPYSKTSTSTMMKTTTPNAAGMVISFKPLHAFTCMLLLLVTAPELLL